MKIEEVLKLFRENTYRCPIIRRTSWKEWKSISFEISHEASLKDVLNCELFENDWEIIYDN